MTQLETAHQATPAWPKSPLWAAVDRLLDELDVGTARAHDLGPLLIERTRARGEAVPDELRDEERVAKIKNLLAPSVLARARAAYDGPMLVLKGPEVAARYPGRARMIRDVDLLVADAAAAWDGLLAAGFARAEWLEGVSPDFYHLDPVELPGVPLPIELHKTFGCPRGLRFPPNEALFEAAVPASVGVSGVLAPTPAHHALLLAGHAWAERPLERLRDLIDVAVLMQGLDERELSRTAVEWGWDRVWQTTHRTIEWLLGNGRKPSAARVWARHLDRPREPTPLDLQLGRWLSPFWAVRPISAVHEVAFEAKLAVRKWRRKRRSRPT
jgi:hypothetical protein